MKKRIFVTGATGFIGANLTAQLLLENHDVHILIRKNSNIWRIKDIISKLQIHEANLTNKSGVSKILQKVKPEVIFHLANLGLYNGIDPAIDNSININTLGTVNLIEATDIIDYECFINTGSSAEYGVKHKPMSELDICEPVTNYALAKLAGTLYAQAYAKKTKKPLGTLRLFSPYGPYDHNARLISGAILTLIQDKTLVINNPNKVRDYIFAEDVIKAYLLCMNNPEKISGEIFNIGTGKQTYIKDVVKLLIKEFGMNNTINIDATSNNKQTMWQADIRKIKKYLGWVPETTLQTGLKKTINWFKKNYHLYG